MFASNKLASAVRSAVLYGAAASVAITANVFAADQDGANDVERIEVTGSRIKRTDLETSSPVSVFNAEDLLDSGYVTVEDFIQNMPAVNGAQMGSSVNNGSAGYASASLRGLGDTRTLILVDGHRFISGDLNLIPISFIKRIEVLRDGASTTYGSDAIAGVINFITKNDFEGVDFTAQLDETSKHDGQMQRFALTTGVSSDRGNVVVNFEYSKRKPILARDRGFSSCPIAEGGGEKFCSGSGTTSPANTSVPGKGNYPKGSYIRRNNGDFVPFDGSIDAYNYNSVSYMQTPQEVFSFNANGTYDLVTDGFSTVTSYTQVSYANRQSEQLMAAEGTFWGLTVPKDNPYNPFGEDVTVSRRLAETGGRRYTQDADTYNILTGFRGMFDNGWSWDVSYQYQRFVDSTVEYGLGNPTRFDILVDPGRCGLDADEPGGSTDTAACPDVWDPFSSGTLTQDMIDYATVPNSPVTTQEMRVLQVNLSGDLMNFELPAGPVNWAIGYENRTESYEEQLDGAAVLGQIYNQPSDSTFGEYRVQEAYGEVDVPILADLPLAHKLSVNAAVRWSDYDYLSSSETTTKYGLEYMPIDGLLLRATKAEGFRAPSLTELYSAIQQNNPSYSDPCQEWATSTTISDVVKANCQNDGVAGDYVPTSNQATSAEGGNPDLKPETSDSFTAGIVYTPSFLPNFNIAIDYYDIEIDDAIGSTGSQNIIDACYNSPNFSSPMCSLIGGPSVFGQAPLAGSNYRSVLGPIAGISNQYANLSTFKTKGIDFDLSYTTPVAGGDLKLGLDGTYLEQYDYTPYAGQPVVKTAGKFAEDQNASGRQAAFPRWRTNFNVGYTTDMYAVNWVTHFMSRTLDISPDPDALDNKADHVFYHDVQASMFFGENYTFTLGARNLFDKEPPYMSAYGDDNTLNTSYDLAGRYMYARVNVRF